MIDLDTLSLKELKKLQKDVTKAIDSFAERERLAVLAELDAIARERGFTIDQVVGAKKSARKPVAPKYANPSDRSQTWSGRGRPPQWVKDAMGKGKKLEDLAI